jgi:anionic cell wall polymer biosynthesis LytR-Cps2A-Psr (LCP) family protein
MTALALAAALTWSGIGSFSTAAHGQEDVVVFDRAHEGARAPTFTEPVFVLVLGSDQREGLSDRTRYDSIHIVAFDPAGMRGSIVGIPRDSYVESAVGNGTRKITDLGFFDGREGFIKTVELLSGCTFDYTMITAFEGFGGIRWRSRNQSKHAKGGGLINAIGGVRLRIPGPGLTDINALHHVDPIRAGTQTLNGPQALAWVRVRGQSNIRPAGDFSRSEAQGEFMLATLAEMKRDYAERPGTALRNVAAVKRLIRVNIPLKEMLDLGLFALDLKPKRIKNFVVDGVVDSANGASIVRITSRGRAQLTDVCADGLRDSS